MRGGSVDTTTREEDVRATAASVRSLDTHRRAKRVVLARLAKAAGRPISWVCDALRGKHLLTRAQVRHLRELIDRLAEVDQ